MPNATGIDVNFNDPWDAMNLPEGKVDYIFSSHCLEHIPNYVDALDYWVSKVKEGGLIFLYLPHKNQRYWLPHNNRKHFHSFEQDDLIQYFKDRGIEKLICSGMDLNYSFTIVAKTPKK